MLKCQFRVFLTWERLLIFLQISSKAQANFPNTILMDHSTTFWSNITSSLPPSVCHLMKTLPFPRVDSITIPRPLLKKKKNLFKPSIRPNSYILTRKWRVLMSISMRSKTRTPWNPCLKWSWCSSIRPWDHITLRRRYQGTFMLSARRGSSRVIFRFWRTGAKA